MKRKHPAAGIGRQTIHGLHLGRVVGLLIFFYYTMLIITSMSANRMGEVYAAKVGSTIHNHEVAESGVKV